MSIKCIELNYDKIQNCVDISTSIKCDVHVNDTIHDRYMFPVSKPEIKQLISSSWI